MNNIILTRNQLVSGTLNRFQYNFPATANLTDCEIALSSINLNYCWFNVTAALGNNAFTYTWIDTTVITVTLPDGFYTVSDINNYLQYVMLAQGHYLVDSSSLNHFYLDFAENVPRYKVQFDSITLPASLPAGWSYPQAGAFNVISAD